MSIISPPPIGDACDLARAEFTGSVAGILGAHAGLSDSDQLGLIREAYRRYRAQLGEAQTEQPARPVRLCKVCNGPIEYVTDGPDPFWWRHTGDIAGQPHAAVPGVAA